MKTKALLRFLNRAARFDGDVEFVDVVAVATKKGKLTPKSGSPLFDHLVDVKHPRLSKQTATDHNRGLVVTHLKRTVHSAFMKDIYEDTLEYLASLLAAAARNGLSPDRLVGDHRLSVEANDLLRCGGWDAVVELVTRSVFRRLEDERSTKKLLEGIDAKLKLGIDKTVVAAALPFLEIRHLLVHRDGIVDADFCRRHPTFGATNGEQIDLGHKVIDRGRTTIVALVKHYDEKAVAAKVIGSADLQ